MKKVYLLITIFSIIILCCVNGQSPQCINYQTIVRNNSDAIVSNQSISIKFSIVKNSTSGQVVYSEQHTTTTNQFGLANLKIGNGSVLSGIFKNIDWGNGKTFLTVYLDINGGNSYTEMGTTEMVSVPYALYAGSIYVHYSNDTLYIGDKWIYLPNGGGSTGGGSTVTDYDGNMYNTISIGDQTWLASNLKSTHYANGSSISGVYDYNNSAATANEYGKLYIWSAVMNGTSSSSSSPSGVQGVCPTGYHVPSIDEWDALKAYVSAYYEVNGGLIGQKLKEPGTTHWETDNGSNETGFSAVGAGNMYILGGEPAYQGLKEGTAFWSATEYSNNTEQALYFKFYDSGVVTTNGSFIKTAGYPVRCLKD
jgi:uncharacterized protein (TIGR02145 family)